jgi:hypothetical protein
VTSKRQSVRGAGRDTSGATGVTMQIWYELEQAGEAGLSFAEILGRVSPRVPAGYAWRKYLANQRSKRKHDIKRRHAAEEATTPSSSAAILDTPANRMRAVRFTIQESLSKMVVLHTAIRRPSDQYAVGVRKPKSYIPDEQLDYDGRISRAAVSDMELIRVLRPVLEQIETRLAQPGRHHLPAISQSLASALKRWFDAHAAHA